MEARQWKKIEELYEAALAEPADQRTEFLKRACADEPALQREIETLLDLASEAKSFLESSPIAALRERPITFSAGEKLGNFEILELIGRGGMGEVYRAKDTRLCREVALKTLPAALAADTERKLRLEREARLLAALNHQHIATIYGLEEAVGVQALAMEYVPGQTLADRLAQGAISVPKCMAIARQIAEALEYAHGKGVIHRDLKPANIKVTPAGGVKVLDFGLAKAVRPPSVPHEQDNSGVSLDGSKPGAILGTPAYMAPEQARGEPADERADIWGFGVLLYEMLTGRRTFRGKSAVDTLAAVLHEDPDWKALPDAVTPDIRTMMRRCLTRDPMWRLRDIGDARIALGEHLANPHAGVLETKPATRDLMPWLIAGALAMALTLVVWAPWRTSIPELPLMRLDVDLGPDALLDPIWGASAILAPDGKRMAFVTRGTDGQSQLSTRRLDQSEPAVLAGTEDAREPFFSPDGSWVGFFTGYQSTGKLKRIPIDGGSVFTICNAPGGHGGSWGADGNIIAALNWNEGLSRISAAGGTPKPLAGLAADEYTHRWPQLLPGGKSVLFTSNKRSSDTFDDATIEVQSLEQGHRKVLQRRASYGRYLPSGHLVFAHEGRLFATPMDLSRLELTGPAKPVLEDVDFSPISGGAQFDFTRSGTFIYGKSGVARNSVQWLDRSGKMRPLLAGPGGYAGIRFSPEGGRLALVLDERRRTSVWTYDLERNTMSRMLAIPDLTGFPVWTPDGERFVFASADGMFWTKSDGSGERIRLTNGTGQFPTSFTPDGTRLAFIVQSDRADSDIWTVALESNNTNHLQARTPALFLGTPADEDNPQFSPDGRWLAYESNESGMFEIYVRPFSGSSGKFQISSGGGQLPIWSRNGRELFFRSLDNRIMAATYSANGRSFRASKPQIWSEQRLTDVFHNANFDLFPDGQKAAIISPANSVAGKNVTEHKITLILNMSMK